MKRIFPYIAAVLAIGLPFLPAAFAHGVEAHNVTGDTSRSIISLYFGYSTGEPMMYVKVKAYPPSQSDMEILQGTTDRNGFFSFVPDEEGNWRVEADDGMGHQGTITINAANDTVSELSVGGSSGGKLPRSLAIVLGLSLLLNVFAVWNFISTTKRGNSDAHQ